MNKFRSALITYFFPVVWVWSKLKELWALFEIRIGALGALMFGGWTGVYLEGSHGFAFAMTVLWGMVFLVLALILSYVLSETLKEYKATITAWDDTNDKWHALANELNARHQDLVEEYLRLARDYEKLYRAAHGKKSIALVPPPSVN